MKLGKISDFFKKEQKDNNNNNSSNEINISYLNQKNNLKNKREIGKINKKLKINSISELEYQYNDSQNKTTITNKPIKKKNFINYSPNMMNSNSEILTKKNNKKLSRQTKSQSSFKTFWESLNQREKERQTRINNLKAESIKRQNSQIFSRPKISKKSITLANLKKREPLYLKRPLNEEIYLDEDFLKFYKKNLEFTKVETKRKENEKKIKQKFDKFYEDNIIWKKQRNDKLENCRNQKNKNMETKSYSFKPIINKNSIRLIKNKEEINNIYSSERSINLNSSKYEKKLLNQLKAKLKPLLIGCYDIYNNRIPNINRRSQYLIRRATSSNVTKRQNSNKTFQNLQNSNLFRNNKKQMNITTEEKKNDSLDVIKKKKNKYEIKRTYESYLRKKFKELDSLNKKNKDLYKLTVREGTSCNPDYINKVILRKEYNYLFESLL